MMRIGQGYDSHRFKDGDHVVIGGVIIPFDKGVQAHSDGDVLLHAIGDALLGALSLGDLGSHFPDTDPNFKAVSSVDLIASIMEMVAAKGYRVVNIDSTVIAEAPKLSKHISAMQECIASLLSVNTDAVGVKATTNEKMGWLGRGEGLAAMAVVLLESQ